MGPLSSHYSLYVASAKVESLYTQKPSSGRSLFVPDEIAAKVRNILPRALRSYVKSTNGVSETV